MYYRARQTTRRKKRTHFALAPSLPPSTQPAAPSVAQYHQAGPVGGQLGENHSCVLHTTLAQPLQTPRPCLCTAPRIAATASRRPLAGLSLASAHTPSSAPTPLPARCPSSSPPLPPPPSHSPACGGWWWWWWWWWYRQREAMREEGALAKDIGTVSLPGLIEDQLLTHPSARRTR